MADGAFRGPLTYEHPEPAIEEYGDSSRRLRIYYHMLKAPGTWAEGNTVKTIGMHFILSATACVSRISFSLSHSPIPDF